MGERRWEDGDGRTEMGNFQSKIQNPVLSRCLVGFLFWGNPIIKPPLNRRETEACASRCLD